MSSEITSNEIRQLCPILDEIENYYRHIYKNISGGFVRSYIDFRSTKYIVVQTWFGCKSDCDDSIDHIESLIERKTMKLCI